MALVDTTTGEVVRADIGNALDAATDPVGFVVACCERASEALTEAHDLTEARDILGAVSTLEHATRVKRLNETAVVAASAMRVRAERRMGELIKAERERGELAGRGRPHLTPVENVPQGNISQPSTLDDHGISRKQASEFTRLADAPADKFEAAINAEADRARKHGGTNVSRKGVLRNIDPKGERSEAERWDDGRRFTDACKRIGGLADDAISAIRFGIYPGAAGDLPLAGDVIRRVISEAREALVRVDNEMRRRR